MKKWPLPCAILTIIIISCSKSDFGELGGLGYSKNNQLPSVGLPGLVSDISNNVIVPAYKKLHQNVKNLEESIVRECSDPNNFNRDEPKSMFLQAMRSYHFTEAFQIGVIARNGHQMRENIYPRHFSLYSVDEQIALKQIDDSHKYNATPNSIGFPALEYLIFEDQLVNRCHPNCREDLMRQWNALSSTLKMQGRCDYMRHLSSLLSKEVGTLRDSWLPSNQDITLTQTYQQDFKTIKEFAIQLTHSLMFFDHIKDERLGIPSGINREWCADDSCPQESEHRHSQDSVFSLIYSVKGLRAIFTGDKIDSDFNTIEAGYGYEEWLIENGHEYLAKDFKNRISNFLENIQKSKKYSIESMSKNISLQKCSETTSEKRTVEICALYQDLKKITDLYKNDFLLAMDFGRPLEQGGDTD